MTLCGWNSCWFVYRADHGPGLTAPNKIFPLVGPSKNPGRSFVPKPVILGQNDRIFQVKIGPGKKIVWKVIFGLPKTRPKQKYRAGPGPTAGQVFFPKIRPGRAKMISSTSFPPSHIICNIHLLGLDLLPPSFLFNYHTLTFYPIHKFHIDYKISLVYSNSHIYHVLRTSESLHGKLNKWSTCQYYFIIKSEGPPIWFRLGPLKCQDRPWGWWRLVIGWILDDRC